MTTLRCLVALAFLTSTACTVPGYAVLPSDLGRTPTPAKRLLDGSPALLVPGTYRVTNELPQGERVVVRGLRTHSKRWLAGVIVTSIGLGLATVGMGFLGYNNQDLGVAGGGAFILAGGIAAAFVGPPLWIAGAQAAPQEVH